MREIERLAEMLVKECIPFMRNDSGMIVNGQPSMARIKYPNIYGCVYSVIQGYGSYGNNDNLLEVQYESGGIRGWVTADEIFEEIKEHWKKGVNG